MNWHIIRTLVLKDLRLYFRNRFFAFITILALVFYAVIYFIMPTTVDDTLEIGVYAPTIPQAFIDQLEEAKLIITPTASQEALIAAMENSDYNVGVVLSEDLMATLAAGQKGQIEIFFTSDFPVELQDIYVILFTEFAYNMAGQELSVDAKEEVLGVDLSGTPIPVRDQMLPLFAILILMMEVMGLASLISTEVEAGTLRALLTTALTIGGLFTAKGIMGVGLAFGQAVFVMAVTGGLSQQPWLILVTLLLGSLLVTGIAFMISSVARDMMSVMGWGFLALLVFTIPTFSILIPGLVSEWIKVIPSYYLVDTVYQAANFDVSWGDMGPNLLILLAFAVVFFALGIVILRRKFQ
jgi:ABC-2 type transport system permease protein